jgi:AcrR family transcriptional regulator
MPETTSKSWGEATRDYKDHQRQAIAHAAMDLIIEHGGGGLSMSALAQRAGISRPTLYRYFPDLDHVLVGVAQVVAEHDLAFEAMVLAGPDPSSQLQTVAAAVVDASQHHPLGGMELEAALPPVGRKLVHEHQARVEKLVADILARGVKGGDFADDLDPKADAALILAIARHARPDQAGRVLHLIDKITTAKEQNQ